MQENEFEKKLQRQMDELQLRPAEELWPRIQVAVAKQNGRKKRAFGFIFFSAVALIAFIITNFSILSNSNNRQAGTTGKNDKENIIAANSLPINTPSSNEGGDAGQAQTAPDKSNTTAVKKLPSSVTLPVDDNGQRVALEANKIERVTKGSPTVSDIAANDNDKSSGNNYKKIRRNSAAAVRTTAVNNQPDELQDIVETPAVALQKPSATAAMPEVTTNDEQAKEPAAGTEKEAPVATVNATEKKKESEIVQPDKTKPNQPRIKKSSSNGAAVWGVSMAVSGGVTSAGNNYNNSNESLVSAYNNGNPGTITGSPSAALEYPSSTKPGVGMGVAIKLYRTLSAKTKLITGLQYRLLTTSIETGSNSNMGVTTPSRDVFTPGSLFQYRNYHHFISVPVGVSTTICSIGSNKVILDAGMDFSRLISTNSLQFNIARPMYYKDNSLFNKTIVGLSAAVAVDVSFKKKSLFSIGPEFYYSLTPLASSGMYAKSHYQYFGIRLQKNLTK